MRDAPRRRLLGILLALPIFGKSWSRGLLDEPSERPPKIASADLALGVVRMINTLEAWHKIRFKHYASQNELRGSGLLAKLLKAPRADEAGIGPDLYSEMNWDSEEILYGWHLQLHVSNSRDAYLLSMRGSTSAGYKTFASDEVGIIYRGVVPQDTVWPEGSYVPLSEVTTGLVPLGTLAQADGPWAHVSALLKRVSFLTMALPQGEFCLDCPCSGTCSGSGQCGCANCGCESCTWCCYAFCSNCRLEHGTCACC